VNPTNWNSYVFLAALVPAISAVYSATRSELPRVIVINGIALAMKIFGMLFILTAALLLINSW
jgi:hypothetical protein